MCGKPLGNNSGNPTDRTDHLIAAQNRQWSATPGF
jgi:hypothetical protein